MSGRDETDDDGLPGATGSGVVATADSTATATAATAARDAITARLSSPGSVGTRDDLGSGIRWTSWVMTDVDFFNFYGLYRWMPGP